MAFWLAMMAAAAAQVTAPGTEAPRPGDITVTGKPVKKVCERISTLGSIIPTRVCKTPEEWEAIRERALAAVQDMQNTQMQRQNAERHREGQ